MNNNTILTPDRPNEPDCTDFTLHDPTQSIWLRIGGLAVNLRPVNNNLALCIDVMHPDDLEKLVAYTVAPQPTQRRRRKKVKAQSAPPKT